MITEPLVLLQFPYSHYNEKARWALDWKRLAHERVSYLPGPHAPQIQRITGKTTTPVLKIGDRVVAESAAIIDELERLAPEPPLYPPDPAERRRALEVQRHFDVEVGPRVRRALFAVLLAEPNYLCHLFSHHRSWLVRTLYRGTFPIAKGMMRKGMGIDVPGAVGEALEASDRALDWVAAESAASGQLVGDRFTVADLAAASLLAPLVELEHPDMNRPRPIPPALAAFYARFAEQPGITWVREQYRRHRPGRVERGSA